MNKNVKLDKIEKSAVAKIHSFSHDGRGIATINNKTTFIPEALPDETVSLQITKHHRHYDEAMLLSIIESSSHRTAPPCQHFGVCGGCSLQHMDIESQIIFKQQTVIDQLNKLGHVTPAAILNPLHANSIAYRHKARLGVKFVIKKNKVLVGFREKSSRYLADLERCVVLHPKIGENLNALRDLIASLHAYQHIPQIEVARGDEDTALVFRHLIPLNEEDQMKLIEFGKKMQFHIYLQPNAPLPVSLLWPTDSTDKLSYTLPDFQLTFHFHPLDFTQVNLAMNRLMVKQAITLLELKNNEKVLDLFCGIGNFTLPIARFAHHVVGIEGSQEMVLRAKDNAKINHIKNADFFTANLDEPDDNAPWLKSHYDKLLLDPARVGAINILPALQRIQAKKIVYVSCNPATLARDANEIVHQYGYKLSKIGIINMFPHTSHIEAMAVFDKDES
ncbi:MAG: hypothetical protein A3F11_10635 [Gammaproteobacteria bacterium RIFCSPHIGHO2_12_FULL_37_14]|nr:MAG: hypothetical protein A3F11_10635 [Gammaproteobacteria bacterium RIFCSPHIGHO2_12_FULL_37_14]